MLLNRLEQGLRTAGVDVAAQRPVGEDLVQVRAPVVGVQARAEALLQLVEIGVAEAPAEQVICFLQAAM